MTGSFCQRVVESFLARPDLVAMRVVGSDDATYTFGETLDQVRSLAYRIRSEGVQFGDRVALIGENHPKWALAYLGTLMMGGVIVPLDPHGEIETLTNFLENSDAKLAFLSPDQVERFKSVEERLGRKVPAVVWDLENDAGDFVRFEDWAAADVPEGEDMSPPAKGDDLAVLMYTSGTTGTPKGVPLTHANILAELEGINYVLKLSDRERILSLLPLFHAYLQIVNLWVATTYGCQVGYLKELTPDELSRAMKEFRPTILTTVPRLWYLFHKKIFDAVAKKPFIVRKLFAAMLSINGLTRRFGLDLGGKFFSQVHASFGGELRIAVSAGSRFDEAVAIDFNDLGFTILQGYGLTETSGAATATPETDNRVGSVGKAMPGAEIKIDAPDKDGVGEVLIKGPIVFSGYYKNPEATKEAFTDDGWFRSGDLGRLDRGHLFIVGRGKDVIVLPSGKNVHPEDLEVHYLKCSYVAELAIIGVKDEQSAHAGAEKLAAIVVPDFDNLKQAKIANSKEAIRHALDSLGRELPEYQRVRDYIIRAEPLPRTATRKIKRFELKHQVESGEIASDAKDTKTWELTAEDRELLESPVGRAVIAAIRQNASEAELIHPDMNLEIDLGLDSLGRAETFAALEQAYAAEFDGDAAAGVLTVRAVIDFIREHADADNDEVSVELNWGDILRRSDDDLEEIHGVLKSRPVFATFVWLLYRIFNAFCRVFMRLEVTGIERIRAMSVTKEDGTIADPFLVCPNHQSFLDPFVLTSNFPLRLFKNIFHVGASEFFANGFMRWLAGLLNVVPVNPDTELMRAMRAGAIGIKHGKVLNIYPEGERAFDGKLHGFKKGAAILATELNVPIVPVALDGLYKVWPRNSWRIRPAKVRVTIGEPFYAKDVIAGRDLSREAAYEMVTSELKSRIESMIADMRK